MQFYNIKKVFNFNRMILTLQFVVHELSINEKSRDLWNQIPCSDTVFMANLTVGILYLSKE